MNDSINFSKTLVILDFDDTLIANNAKRDIIESDIISKIQKLRKLECSFYISSRNPTYLVKAILVEHKIDDLFTEIIADYRPKKYHILNILMDLNKESKKPELILFIDDHIENCKSVKEIKKEIEASLLIIQFENNNIHNLKSIFTSLEKGNVEKLKDISFK